MSFVGGIRSEDLAFSVSKGHSREASQRAFDVDSFRDIHKPPALSKLFAGHAVDIAQRQ